MRPEAHRVSASDHPKRDRTTSTTPCGCSPASPTGSATPTTSSPSAPSMTRATARPYPGRPVAARPADPAGEPAGPVLFSMLARCAVTRWTSGRAERHVADPVADVAAALRPPMARQGPARRAHRRRGRDPPGDGLRHDRRPPGGGRAVHVHGADGRLRPARRVADAVGEHDLDRRHADRLDAARGRRRRVPRTDPGRRPGDAHAARRRDPARAPGCSSSAP